MSNYSFTVVIQKEPEDDGYLAYVPGLPGCNSGGLTVEEARANIQEALQGFVEMLKAHGDPIPAGDLPIYVEEIKIAA